MTDLDSRLLQQTIDDLERRLIYYEDLVDDMKYDHTQLEGELDDAYHEINRLEQSSSTRKS